MAFIYRLLFLSALFIYTNGYAQLPAFNHFDKLTTKEGLSSDALCKAYRDSKGFVWIASQDGLNRYDGFHIRKYYHSNTDSFSVIDNWINNVHEDKEGTLWVSTRGGLCIYDHNNDRFIPYRFRTAAANSSNVLKFEATWHGHLLFCVDGNLLIKDPVSGKETLCIIPPKIPMRNYFNVHPFGNTLFIGHRGLYFVDWNSKQLSRKAMIGNHIFSIDNDAEINFFFEDPQFIWMCTWGNGIYRLDKQTTAVEQFLFDHSRQLPGNSNICFNLIEKKQRNGQRYFLLGTERGLQTFEPATGQFNLIIKNKAENGAHVLNPWYMYEDKQGVIWIEDADHGISIYRPGKNLFRSVALPSGIPGSTHYFTAAAIDYSDSTGNSIWLSSWGAGLMRYHLQKGITGRYLYNKNNADSYIGAVYTQPNGLIWVNKNREWGLLNKTGDFDPIQYNGRSLRAFIPCNDNQQNTWFRNDSLLMKRSADGTINTYRIPESLRGKRIYGALVWDSRRNRMWYSYLSGIGYFDIRNERFADSNATKRLPLFHDADLRPLDDKGNLVIRDRRGLFLFNPDSGSATLLSVASGLLSNNCYGYLQDNQQYYWINTGNGLSKLKNDGSGPQHYMIDDPVIGNHLDVDMMRLPNGHFAFPYFDHIVTWDPNDFNTTEKQPRLFLTDIRVNDIPYHRYKRKENEVSISVSHRENYIRIGIGMDEYMFPESHQVRYRINGSNWLPMTNQQLDLILKPGTHQIELSSLSNNTGWNDKAFSIRIRIRPPFWQRWWFAVLVFIAAFTLAWKLYRYRINQLLKLQRVRNTIAQDLHDDVGSTMTTISILSQVAQQNKEPEATNKLLSDIGGHSRQLLDKLDDIVWSVNPKNDSLQQITLRMKQLAIDLLGSKNIKVEFDTPADINSVPMKMENRRNLYLIYKEALHNISKYSQATQANVRIAHVGRFIEMDIRDNGIGFDPSTVKKGNGLGNMLERAVESGGECKVESAPGEGVAISVRILLE